MSQNHQSPLGIGKMGNAMYGSDYMVEVIRELGIRYIALNPGASYRGLHDSIVNFPGDGPEMILCTHEEIAVALANGYFRACGQPIATGLHNVVGLQHASMAIFNAWCDRSAILNLGGGGPIDANHRRSTDWVHTALVQGNAVRDYVKFDDQPNSVEATAESLLRAMRTAMTDPKGPVYICLDSDLQEQRLDSPLTVPDASLFRVAKDGWVGVRSLLPEEVWRIQGGLDTPHATAAEGHSNLIHTMAMDRAAKLGKEISLPIDPEEFYDD